MEATITESDILAVCGNEIGNPSYPAHSNAMKTEMFTVCKRCGKPNGNGYQYCTACHRSHKRKSPKRSLNKGSK